MRRKQVISLLTLVAGIALLVAATSVGAASSATKKKGSAEAKKGGTLRVNEASADFDFVDPQLAYRTDDWAMLYTTSMPLVGFQEKAGAAGAQLVPIGATSFPTVSKNGRVYTFHVRKGLRFSDGTRVTAAAYQRSWERILSPKMGSPLGVNLDLQNTVVGGKAFLDGKAAHISGIKARGNTISFTLTKPNATFVSILSMQWFTPVKPNMPYSSKGVNVYPAAGPYYIASRDPGRSTVLKRNPYYKGNRPANPDQIVFTPNVNPDQSLLQIKAGQSDFDLGQIPPTAAADLAKQFGVNKGRFFVGPTSCVSYMAMNNARAPFNNVNLRKAVEYAIDRPAQVRLLGAYAGKRTSQMLVPGIPGYKPYNAYPIKGADVSKAKQVGGSAIASAPTLRVIHTTSASSTNRAQVAEFNLKQVGFKIDDVPTPATNFYQVIQTKGTNYNFTTNGGWCADYFDPFDYLNVLFDGRKIQAANNNNYAYFNSPAFNKGLDHAASLSGPARAAAYAKLDRELMVKYAPVVPYVISTNRYFVSSRTKNWIYSTYFGAPYMNALAVG
ncbi:MAG TPA: ABC transporter substrate-binding protein [Gaiellaceae bacterium]|jgi:peptide/nickel transport system substrate-binding protein|nr:ABC transporter substrate-binding protein [Gaiellaceae bacterium]